MQLPLPQVPRLQESFQGMTSTSLTSLPLPSSPTRSISISTVPTPLSTPLSHSTSPSTKSPHLLSKSPTPPTPNYNSNNFTSDGLKLFLDISSSSSSHPIEPYPSSSSGPEQPKHSSSPEPIRQHQMILHPNTMNRTRSYALLTRT